jgi:Tfp pilus assembly protein PilE
VLRPYMKNKREENGFLFIELVVGIALLAVGITLVIQAFSSAARAHAVSRDMVEAVFLMEDKIQELGFKEQHGRIGQEPLEAAGTMGRFAWRYAFVPEQDTDLYVCTLSVAWKEARRNDSLTVHTYCVIK